MTTTRYIRRSYRQTRTLACHHVVVRFATIPLNHIGGLFFCADCKGPRVIIGETNDTWTRDPDHQLDEGSLLESLADERQVSAAETARRLGDPDGGPADGRENDGR